MAVACLLVGLHDVPPREVAAAHVDDLALTHQLLHRLPDLFPRRCTVDVVHLVQIDVVGVEAAQAGLTRVPDVAGGEAPFVGPVPHLSIHLAGQDDFLAPAVALGKPAADDPLRVPCTAPVGPAAVAVGRVEEVDAVLEGTVHDHPTVLLRRLGTKVHGSQAQAANLQSRATQVRIVHLSLPPNTGGSRETEGGSKALPTSVIPPSAFRLCASKKDARVTAAPESSGGAGGLDVRLQGT